MPSSKSRKDRGLLASRTGSVPGSDKGKASPNAAAVTRSSDYQNQDQRRSSSRQAKKFRHELRNLQEEMEVVPLGRRRQPKKLAKAKTRKRKELEQRDLQQLAIERDLVKRMRGPRAAEEDAVIEGSLVFRGANQRINEKSYQDEENSASSAESSGVEDDEGQSDEIDEHGRSESGTDAFDSDDAEASSDGERVENSVLTAARKQRRPSGIRRPRRKSRIYRMSNFKSIKMTERHGDAMASYARGQHREAIEKLQSVARELPSAPQVYSSLGLVYEEMLRDLEKRRPGSSSPRKRTQVSEVHGSKQPMVERKESRSGNSASLDELLSEQLALAKKAYGSYHIAALLCKKDYSLWIRAGDLAVTIGDLHGDIAKMRDLVDTDREHHRSERQRWLSEAKNDYQTADGIKVPGIDIPAKLAAVCIELGSLSEAMTILTDLKNRTKSQSERSDFEASYKAWILYADLMLRIGYECTKWNEAEKTTANVSFRRWLRRHSNTFEWEERRLQALAKALEAAAGSECCRNFNDWLERRAVKANTKGDDADVAPDDDQHNSELFEIELSLLRQRNAQELADFDKTTGEINDELATAPAAHRRKSRDEIIRRHDGGIKELEEEFRSTTACNANDESTGLAPVSVSAHESEMELPLSASITTVCDVASDLLRHLIFLKSYDGGRLVGDAVSSYLKERAFQIERRITTRRAFEENLHHANSALHVVMASRGRPDESKYDMSSDNESVAGLSDDDELEKSPPAIIVGLKRGCLPPELNVLFATCLLGEGNRDFVALKYLNSIQALDQESFSSMAESTNDVYVSLGLRWLVFRGQQPSALLRNEAFAMVADVLRDCSRDEELAEAVAPLFEKQRHALMESGLFSEQLSPNQLEGLDVAVKVVNAAARFQCFSARSLASASKFAEAMQIQRDSCKTLTTALQKSWKVYPDASVSSSSVSILETLDALFNIFSSQPTAIGTTAMSALSGYIEVNVSILSDTLKAPVEPTSNESLPDMTLLPLSSFWLNEKRRAIARLSFNLAVSMNVSRFSGWESQEFRMELLRRRSHASGHFGITMSDGLVAGMLVPFEDEIIEQWEMLERLLAVRPHYCFRELLQARRESPLYREAKQAYDKRKSRRIAAFGEENGLSILLAYSRTILSAQKSTKEAHDSLKSHLNALCVLLPLLQFILKCRVWDADIGSVSETRSPILDWRSIPSDEKKEDEAAQASRIRRRRITPSNDEGTDLVALNGSFVGERSAPLSSNLVIIPCWSLLAAWNDGAIAQATLGFSPSNELMANLHMCLKELRGCRTEKAVEAASLKVAVNALKLVGHPNCLNPFLSMHLASLFASHAPKLGSSDAAFKNPLPEKENCSATEALEILARADCLQAVHFCAEAAFLCDYVAKTCRLHRVVDEAQIGLSKRWSVVRAVAYNVSVGIRNTARILGSNGSKKSDSTPWTWQKNTVDELNLGRNECLCFLGSPAAAAPASEGNDQPLAFGAELTFEGNPTNPTSDSLHNEMFQSPHDEDGGDTIDIVPV